MRIKGEYGFFEVLWASLETSKSFIKVIFGAHP